MRRPRPHPGGRGRALLRAAALLAPLLVAAPALGAPPAQPPWVSSEITFGPPVEGPAYVAPEYPRGFYERVTAAAFDGSTHLAVWSRGNTNGVAPVHATRVLSDGTVPDPPGVALGVGRSPQVAAAGAQFLVVFSAIAGEPGAWTSPLRAARVSSGGEALDPGGFVIAEGANGAVASDGEDFLIVWAQYIDWEGSELRAARVTAAGDVVPPGGALVAGKASHGEVHVAFGGASYLAVWRQYGDSGDVIRGARLGLAGELLAPGVFDIDAAPESFTASRPRVAFDGARWHVAWSGDGGVWARRVTLEGTLADPASTLVQPDLDDLSAPVLDDVAFDGEHVRVLWTRVPDFSAALTGLPAYLYVARLGADGAVLAPGAIQVSPQAQRGALAGALAIWQNDRADGFHHGLYGARIGGDGSLLDAPPLRLGRGTNAQWSPAITFDDEHTVVAWLDDRHRAVGEGDTLFAARVAADGRVLDAGGARIATASYQPRLVWSGPSTLALWNSEADDNDDVSISGARLTSSLEVMDAEPLELGAYFAPQGFSATPDVEGFAVLCGDRLVRVSHEGDVLGTALADGAGPGGEDWRVLGFDGAQHVVVWNALSPSNGIRASRLDAGVEILDPGGVALLDTAVVQHLYGFSVTHGGGTYLAAWRGCAEGSDLMRVEGVRFRVEGGIQVLDAEPLRLDEAPQACGFGAPGMGSVHAAFDGERFVVVWQRLTQPGDAESADLFGAAISPDGAVTAPFPVSAEPGPEATPALAARGAGESVVVYSRQKPGLGRDSSRVYARRLGAPPEGPDLVAVGGCACRAAGGPAPPPPFWPALLGLAAIACARARRRGAAPILGLVALLGAAGCGDAAAPADPPEPAPPDPPYTPVDPDGFEVGTGTTAFEPLAPGATVEVVAGSQGGYHIWLGVRCGACGPEVIASYGVDDAETGELLTFQGLQQWLRLEEEGGWRQAVGLIGFLNDGDPSVYVGRPVRLWASIAEEGSGAPPLEGDAHAIVSGIAE